MSSPCGFSATIPGSRWPPPSAARCFALPSPGNRIPLPNLPGGKGYTLRVHFPIRENTAWTFTLSGRAIRTPDHANGQPIEFTHEITGVRPDENGEVVLELPGSDREGDGVCGIEELSL